MDDYYKILNVEYNASQDDIISNYNNIMIEYKIQPFISDNDKTKIKLIKKAYFVLTNDEYKKIYDLNLKQKQQIPQMSQNISSIQSIGILPQSNVNNKKGNLNNSYIADRIFSMNNLNSNKTNYNIDHSELLRPKNVGLSSDVPPEYDTPLDFDPKKNNEILPFDSI